MNRSVEAVTKDFFDQYREKYLELKEYLDGNSEFTAEAQSRGFDSEQFAKKLMGQIVFLYFIQKKGWLGVNAFPSKLTEREYKAGFYRPGRKPKELMPFVYKQAPDGNFNLDINALLSLTSEDETTLSTLVKGDAWGDGPKDFMRRIFDGCKKVGKNFFDDYLEPLFYTCLNQNRKDNAFFLSLHCDLIIQIHCLKYHLHQMIPIFPLAGNIESKIDFSICLSCDPVRKSCRHLYPPASFLL